MAPAYFLQSVRWGPWPCRPKNDIQLLQGQEIPQPAPIAESLNEQT